MIRQLDYSEGPGKLWKGFRQDGDLGIRFAFWKGHWLENEEGSGVQVGDEGPTAPTNEGRAICVRP